MKKKSHEIPEPSGASVAVIGAGPMGLLLSAVLAQTRRVVLVCRNPFVREDIARSGVVVRGADSEGILAPEGRVELVGSITDLGRRSGLGSIFIATKTSAIVQVARELRSVLERHVDQGMEPLVVSFQNGIDPGRELIRRLDHSAVLRMVLTLGAVQDERPGAVRMTLNRPPHAIGTLNPSFIDDCQRLSAELTAGGLDTEYREDIESIVWQKGLVNAAMNPLAALTNGSVSEVLDSPSAVLVPRLLDEGILAAGADGVELPVGFRTAAVALIEQARGHVPSMVEDIRRGRTTEVGQLNRQIIERAKAVGVPTPTHEIVDALIETFDWRVYTRSGFTDEGDERGAIPVSRIPQR